jgi:hypothetical protein
VQTPRFSGAFPDLIDDAGELPGDTGVGPRENFRNYRDMARNLEQEDEDDEEGLEKFLQERYQRYDQVRRRPCKEIN